MEMAIVWVQLAVAAAMILAVSLFLAKSADAIGFKTGLGRTFAGVVLLAAATSLPEIAASVGSIVIEDAPDLAAGGVFGSNLVNLFIIGILDLRWRCGPLLNSVPASAAKAGAWGIVVISLASAAIFVYHTNALSPISGWYVSPVSVGVLAAFLFAMRSFTNKEGSGISPTEIGGHRSDPYESISLSRAIVTFTASAVVVVGIGIWLAHISNDLSVVMRWEASFVGTQFQAVATSLPEMAVSFAALKINAPEMAVANLLGSNIFNMGFVLFLSELALTDGTIWANFSEVHMLTGIVGILMTFTVMFGLLKRPRSRLFRYWTIDGLVLTVLYAGSSLLVFNLA